MEPLNIDNISLSDFRIKNISLGEDYDEMDIVSEGSVRISDLKKFEETLIKIKNWEELRVRKYVTQKPFDNQYSLEIDWTYNLETFDFIQELILKEESRLILNGFSKESGAWLTYEFSNFEYEIQIKKTAPASISLVTTTLLRSHTTPNIQQSPSFDVRNTITALRSARFPLRNAR